MEEILSLYPEELKERLALLGVPAYRASQIFSWLHVKRALSFSEMTDIPKALREQLSGQFVIHALKPVLVQKSKEDGTEKVLFGSLDPEKRPVCFGVAAKKNIFSAFPKDPWDLKVDALVTETSFTEFADTRSKEEKS